MKKQALALAAAAALGAIASTSADAQWMVRGRAVYLDTANKSDPIPSLAVPADKITVNSKWIPELDIAYFFTPNIAAELVLTVPQKHDVTIEQSALGGPTKIGSFKHLPPSLMAQYHFLPGGRVQPYVGAGLNYTRIMSVNLNVPTVGDLKLEKDSVGLAFQIGMDIPLTKTQFINLDIKKVYIQSDVFLAGSKISTVKVDPILWGIGYGVRF